MASTGLLGTALDTQASTLPVGITSVATPDAQVSTASPVVAATPATVASVAAPSANIARTLTDKETVSGQLNNLLNQDSTYMQSAKANANGQMNSRGLINSSMAVGASQKAAIDSALPIAQQDATANSNSGQLAQQGNQDIKLATQNSLLGSAQANENSGYRVKENQQNIDANKELKAIDSQNALTLQAAKAKDDAALRQQADEASLKQALAVMDPNNAKLDIAKLDATTKNELAKSYGTLSQQRLDTIKGINMTPTSQLSNEDKARMIDQINKDFDSQAKTMFQIAGYTYTSSWSGDPGAPQTPTSNADALQVQKDAQAAKDAANHVGMVQDIAGNWSYPPDANSIGNG